MAVFTFGALLLTRRAAIYAGVSTKPEVIKCSTFGLLMLTYRGKMVRTPLRAGVIGATLLMTAAGVAAAEPLPLADVSRSAVTRDGWQLTASLKNMTINSVPNFAATAFTREAFVSAEADASIDGNGSVPVNTGSLMLGVQVGCQIDLSLGGYFGVGQSAVPFAPIITLKLLPGRIANVGLGRTPIKGRTGTIFIHDAEVKADACGGDVSLRFFATALIDSDTSQDSETAYGDVIHI